VSAGLSEVWRRWQGHQSDGWLSAEGVEWAAVLVLLGGRVVNAAQLAAAVPYSLSVATRPSLDALAAAAFTASAAVVAVAAVRAHRLRPRWLLVDVTVGVVVVAVTPLFLPAEQLGTWAAWPFAVTLLTVSAAAACLTLLGTTLAALALGCTYLSCLAYGPPSSVASTVVINAIAFPAFAYVTFFLARYLRRLAALADARGAAIELLEQEKTRRILHTPHRLLNDLTTMLREEMASSGQDSGHRARLAEAVASAREIEAIVRGTSPVTGNLAGELQGLCGQFVDLPLVMNIDGLAVYLPTRAVYRVREAVRSALQNVRLHAHADQVVVFATSESAGWLVSVYDNGDGFDPHQPRHVGVEELIVRAIGEIGGHVNIETAPGEGTLIEITGGA
jgi:hypothetical protein